MTENCRVNPFTPKIEVDADFLTNYLNSIKVPAEDPTYVPAETRSSSLSRRKFPLMKL